MSYDELDLLLGQMFMFGFQSHELTEEMREYYQTFPVGNVIFFRRNIVSVPQVQKLTKDLKEMSAAVQPDIPLIIAVDQEGGNLSPLRGIVTSLPGNMGIAATGELSAAYYAGRTIGNDLQSLGINLNLTPVLDLALHSNPVVSTRAFSDQPELVAALGREYAKGLYDSGMLFTGKHFPGHGSCKEDSHISIPICRETAETLRQRDLIPFLELIKQQAASIMMAHVQYLSFDPENPASLSPVIIKGLLREQLGYQGVILTDCLEMDAVQKLVPYPEDAVRAIEAGVDIVVISHTLKHQHASYQAVREAVKSGRIKSSQLEQSYQRIVEWKKNIGRQAKLPFNSSWSPQTLAEQVITLGDCHQNWKFDKQRCILVTPEMGQATFAEDSTKIDYLVDELNKIPVPCDHYQCAENPSDGEIQQLFNQIKSSEAGKVVFVVSNILSSPGQIRCIEKIATAKKVLLVSTRNPRELTTFGPEYPKIYTYSTEAMVLKALASVLSGDLEAKGRMPIHLVS
jgi:beta-N-acetylhexosaminidase